MTEGSAVLDVGAERQFVPVGDPHQPGQGRSSTATSSEPHNESQAPCLTVAATNYDAVSSDSTRENEVEAGAHGPQPEPHAQVIVDAWSDSHSDDEQAASAAADSMPDQVPPERPQQPPDPAGGLEAPQPPRLARLSRPQAADEKESAAGNGRRGAQLGRTSATLGGLHVQSADDLSSIPPPVVEVRAADIEGAAKQMQSRSGLARLSRLSRNSVVSIREVPRGLVRSALVIAINALLMATAEIVIEVLILAGVYPKLPFRLDFFFLTLLSGLLGYHVVRGMQKDQFDTSINALQVSVLVEAALIAGDIKFMVEEGDKYDAAVPTRTPFAILTGVNLVLATYLGLKLFFYHRGDGNWPESVRKRWCLHLQRS